MYLCSRGVTPRTQHREVHGSNPVRIFFVYSLFLFFFFSFAFLVWKFDVFFVGLLVFFLMVTVNRRGRYYYWIYIIVHGMQSVTLTCIIGFIHGQRIFFTLCDCRSEGVVPANTLKRLVRKRKYENIFS